MERGCETEADQLLYTALIIGAAAEEGAHFGQLWILNSVVVAAAVAVTVVLSLVQL